MVRLRVHDLAHARGISLAQLQQTTRLPGGTLRRYWHRRVQYLALDALERIADALQVDVAELLVKTQTGDPTPTTAQG